MAKTLLNGVNELLKRVGLITGDAQLLTSLTDSARQISIDVAVQVINEGIDELYSASNVELAKGQGSSTVTLVNAQRDYTLASDVVQIRWPMVDRTNSQYLSEYPGGYNAMLLGDLEQDDTGLPHYAAVRPTDGKLFMDRAPTSVEAGRVYVYQYDKDTVVSLAADNMPFDDAVFRAMVPAWVQLWKRERRNEFDQALYSQGVGRASRLMTKRQQRDSWSPR